MVMTEIGEDHEIRNKDFKGGFLYPPTYTLQKHIYMHTDAGVQLGLQGKNVPCRRFQIS
jgi:hypothetical protein